MEEKLLRYRREKSKEKFRKELKDKFKHLGSKFFELSGFLKISSGGRMPENDHTLDLSDADEDNESIPEEDPPCYYLQYFTVFLVWLTLYLFFIYIEFGAVYFCVSGLLFIYFNTRTGRKIRNEISAYSVFNRNCEQIDGTFTAEQFDKQIRSGML